MTAPAFNERQIDALKEIANIGVGNGATSLSRLIGLPVELRLPDVQIVHLSDIDEALGGAESSRVGVAFRLDGDLRGRIAVVFTEESARLLLEILRPDDRCEPSDLDEMGRSALGEVGNLLSASFANALASLLGLRTMPSAPGTSVDMAGALSDSLLADLAADSDEVVLIVADFAGRSPGFSGSLLLLLDAENIGLLLARIEARVEDRA